MINYNKYIYFIYIFFITLLFNYNYCNGLILKNISQFKVYYKSYSSTIGLCHFSFEIICVVEQAQDNCQSIVLSNDTYSSASVYNFATQTNSVFLVNFQIPVCNHSTIVNGIYPIDLECKLPDFNKFSFKPLSNIYRMANPFFSGMDLYSTFELVGSEEDVSTKSMDFEVVNLQNKCSFLTPFDSPKYYTLSCISHISDFSSIKLNVSTFNTFKIFDLIFLNNDYVNLYDIKTYPDLKYLNGKLELFGYGESALIQFKLNTTFDKGSYYLDFPNSQSTQVYPIYNTNDSSTTYLTSLNNYNSLTKYELYYVSGSNLIKSTDISLNISQFVTTGLPSDGNLVIDSSYSMGLPIITSGFTFAKKKDYAPIQIILNDKFTTLTRWPYGYLSLDSEHYIFEASTLVKKNTYIFLSTGHLLFNSKYKSSLSNRFPFQNSSFVYDSSLQPKVYQIEKIHIEDDVYLVRLSIKSGYGLDYITTSTGQIINYLSLISGDIFDGVYEFTFSTLVNNFLEIYDRAEYYSIVTLGQIISINEDQVERFIAKPIINFNIFEIQDVSFLYNDIDITNFRHYNVLYFNYSDDVPRDTLFRLVPFGSSLLTDPVYFNSQQYNNKFKFSFPSIWDDELKLFKIKFYIESNSEAGNYQFAIASNLFYLPCALLKTQLRIKKTNMDNQGPVFKNIEKILPKFSLSSTSGRGSIGWKLTIEDQINGFKNGYVVIRGELDQSIYNSTFSLSDVLEGGNQSLGVYQFTVIVSYPCISQNYIISDVGLYDNSNKLSFFSIFPPNEFSTVTNPFINYLHDTDINKVSIQCEIDSSPASSDTTPPELLSFNHNGSLVFEVGKSSRVIQFEFSATDSESGMKSEHRPIVYLTAHNNQIIECVANIVKILDKTANYSCSIQVPLGFGYPDQILFSVYGFINNKGLWSGFSTKSLFNLGLKYYISTEYLKNDPFITDSNQITENGGILWLYGSSLLGTKYVYVDYGEDQLIQILPNRISSTAIKVSGIKATKKPFQVYVQVTFDASKTTEFSNTFTVTPIVFGNNFIECNNRGIPDISGEYCKCNSKWITIDELNQCSIPNHYISTSTQVSSTTGGKIIIYGWFGDINYGPVLYIDNKFIPSENVEILPDSITAIIGSGNIGPVQVNYTQNDIKWNGIIYPYLDSNYECPPKCSINGQCDKSTGKCKCSTGYTGIDCSSPVNNNNNNTGTEIGNNGTTIIKNQDIGYLISIDSIVELDLNGKAVSTFNLTNNWIFVNTSNSITTFNQIIKNNDNSNLFIGSTILTLIIEEVNDKDKDFSFAGNQFTVTKGGFKLSISISNWQYQSNLNTLQIQMSSDIQINQSNSCNNDNNNAAIESSSNYNYLPNNINYLKVTKNGRSLYARFQDKILADNRPATVLVQLLSSPSNNLNSIKLALNLPRCNECLIDPDFSLLITSDYKECRDSTSNKWVIAVSVVAGVVGASILFILLFIVYKKSTFLKIKVYKFRKHLNNNIIINNKI